ncbi:MAG: putative Ig domain-containing protein, partial [Gemmatimonadota bacterium]|nr:putative Ig domain-containing protein [Gemmatimonadota bacterium]
DQALALSILPPPVSITTAALPGGQVTIAYGPATLAATGGTGSFTWSVTGGALPAGLSLSSGGVLNGTPTASGSFNVTVRATSGTVFAEQALALNILPPPVTIMTGSPLPPATIGVLYSQTLQATGGTGSFAWSVTAGALPAGLTLSSGGVLSGGATAVGTASFTAQAVSGPVNASKAFSLTVGYPTAISLAFQPGPSGSQCYAINAVLAPNIAVKTTDQNGNPVAGVLVNLVAVTNNGSKVVVSQPSAVSGATGLALFNTLSINKTGGYRLIASTTAPWPTASLQSGKFTISPSCP